MNTHSIFAFCLFIIIMLIEIVSPVNAFPVFIERTYDYQNGGDVCLDLVQTGEGYLLVGIEQENYDIWLLYTDFNGEPVWNKTYGGTETFDVGGYVIKTNDGGFAISGYTHVIGEKNDGLLLKIDALGNLEWSKTYGGLFSVTFGLVLQETDDGYVLFGQIRNSEYGETDSLIIRTDSDGNEIWRKQYGGSKSDSFSSRTVIKTSDDGYILGGYTSSFGNGGIDFWLVNVDSSGNLLWEKSYGDDHDEYLSDIIQTTSGDFLLIGNKDVIVGVGKNASDIEIVKTDSNGNQLWSNTYGKVGNHETVNSGVELVDGIFILVGRNWSLSSHVKALMSEYFMFSGSSYF